MTTDEQDKLLRAALSALSRRCSLDPHRNLPSTGDHDEFADELDDRLFAAWPGDWPERQIVDLDNTGDAGMWLRENPGKPVSALLFLDGMDY